MRGRAPAVAAGGLLRLSLRGLRECPVGGPAEMVRQLTEVLDQALAFLRELRDVRIDLFVVRVGLRSDMVRVGGRLGPDLLAVLARLRQDLLCIGPDPGAVSIGLLADPPAMR